MTDLEKQMYAEMEKKRIAEYERRQYKEEKPVPKPKRYEGKIKISHIFFIPQAI